MELYGKVRLNSHETKLYLGDVRRICDITISYSDGNEIKTKVALEGRNFSIHSLLVVLNKYFKGTLTFV